MKITRIDVVGYNGKKVIVEKISDITIETQVSPFALFILEDTTEPGKFSSGNYFLFWEEDEIIKALKAFSKDKDITDEEVIEWFGNYKTQNYENKG
jgi:hypothetical protein